MLRIEKPMGITQTLLFIIFRGIMHLIIHSSKPNPLIHIPLPTPRPRVRICRVMHHPIRSSLLLLRRRSSVSRSTPEFDAHLRIPHPRHRRRLHSRSRRDRCRQRFILGSFNTIMLPQPLPLLLILQFRSMRDIERGHRIRKIILQRSCFDASLVFEMATLVAEAGDDFREVVVEFPGLVDAVDDFLVGDVGVCEALEGAFAVLCGGIAAAGGGEGGVGGFEVGGELVLEVAFGGDEGFVGVVGAEAGFEEVFELGGFDFLHGEVSFEAGCFGEDYVVWGFC